MNNKLKYILIASILIISSILVVSAVRQPNDYFAFVQSFENFDVSPSDDNKLDLTYNVVYIPLSASSTYTFTVSKLVTTINISQPAQINNKIQASIVNESILKGYNLKHIIMQSYNVITP